jgi:hypothetical protein
MTEASNAKAVQDERNMKILGVEKKRLAARFPSPSVLFLSARDDAGKNRRGELLKDEQPGGQTR